MDWFERITGFRELGYGETRARLAVEGTSLISRENGTRWGIGTFEMPSLAALRSRVEAGPRDAMGLGVLQGDVRGLHGREEHRGALFQVASQFNALEMVSPEVTPEHGVTRYAGDRTQGPACAMAAGAATIYRNYLVPVPETDRAPEATGQTRDRQLDGLAGVGRALGVALGCGVDDLWTMRNGYALCTREGLARISGHLRGLAEADRDALRGRLRIGLHWDVEVTDAPSRPGPLVSQAFCAALPVSYSGLRDGDWQPFAQLVLEAAYEATLLAARINRGRRGSPVVLLTRLGGGVFGNDPAWIDAAMGRALRLAHGTGLDVRIVSHGSPGDDLLGLVRDCTEGPGR